MSRKLNGFDATNEQNAFIGLALSGQTIKGEASAGSGKSTVLIGAADEMQGKGMVIAFNKAIADEMSAKLKRQGINCTSRTSHSLAWAKFGNQLKHRLPSRFSNVPRLSGRNVAQFLHCKT